jgi:DNA-binding ferritin-like protein
MKRFSDIQKRTKIRRLNEADANLPANYEDMSKEDLIKLMTGKKEEQPSEEREEDKEEVKQLEPSTEGKDVSNFFSKLFESREMAHVYHLQVRGDEGSFARHEALGKYYEEVLEIIDDVIEVYQGQYGIVENYDVIDTSGTKSKEPVDYFEELAEYVKHARKCITNEDTHTHSLLDDIVVLIYKTLYRLKFNK